MSENTGLHAFKVASFSALANWIGDLILYPLDTVSTRLKANKFANYNPFRYLYNSIKSQKLKLYRGIGLSFPAAFIPTAIYVGTYEYLMKKISKIVDDHTDRKQLKLLFPFFISAFAEFLCLWPYLPVDTVRTRIQMNHPDYQYTTLFKGLKQIQRKEGFWRLYKSTRIYFACKTMYMAIQFQIFEMIRFFAGPGIGWLIFNTIASTAVATTLLNPMQVLLTRYALVDTTKKKLVFSMMVERIYKKQGIAGFYKGYGTQLLAHCLYSLFWMPTYQILRQYYGNKAYRKEIKPSIKEIKAPLVIVILYFFTIQIFQAPYFQILKSTFFITQKLYKVEIIRYFILNAIVSKGQFEGRINVKHYFSYEFHPALKFLQKLSWESLDRCFLKICQYFFFQNADKLKDIYCDNQKIYKSDSVI